MTQRLRLSLAAWRRLSRKHDPAKGALPWKARLSYTSSGLTQSALMRIQDASHAEALKTATPYPPIFLLGFWRSGTTFLHELLCCDPRFGFPSTYACLNPAQFLATEKLIQKQGLQQARRPMDDVRYSWGSPQEDEFALLCMDAPSPYEALILPSLMQNPRGLVDFSQFSIADQERWGEALQHFLRLLTVQQNKPMVLKSPPHGFRLSTLISLFPEARYILIERNPYEVFASNVKLWHTLTDLYGLEPAGTQEIDDFVLKAYVLHEQAIVAGRKLAKPHSFTRVRYEDLLVDPIGQMERLYTDLNLGEFAEVRPQLEKYLAGVAGHKRNRFQISPVQKQRIDEVWGPFISDKRYNWTENYISLVG